jgi:hypothetical protein
MLRLYTKDKTYQQYHKLKNIITELSTEYIKIINYVAFKKVPNQAFFSLGIFWKQKFEFIMC